MMRFAFFVLLGIIFSAVAQTPFGYDQSENDAYLNRVEMAMRRAAESMREKQLSSAGKFVVVQEKNKFLVVSFLISKPVRGGAVHLVYDVGKDRIVYIRGEQ